MRKDLESELSDVMQFLYACPVGMVDFDIDGTIGMMNPMAMQLLQPLNATPFDFNFFSSFERCGPELRNLAQSFEPQRGTVCENHRIVVATGSGDGRVEPRVLSCTMLKLSGERFMVTLSDVSLQAAQERRLRQAETWFSSLLERAEDFDVVSLNADGRIESASASVLGKTGLEEAGVVGQRLDVFDDPDPDTIRLSAAEQIALARRDGWHLDEGWQRQCGGGRRWCQRLIVVQGEQEGNGDRVVLGYTAVLRAVTRQEFDTAKLRRMLRTDHLTGVCNRARFFEIGERELHRSVRDNQALAVIALDVDHFKHVNDTYGHAIGDHVLKAIAKACEVEARPTDTFARLGGEEFVVLLPSTGLQGAADRAERLRAVVAGLAVPVPGGLLRVTASFRCAGLTSSTRTLESLLAQADGALYAAKRAGRNRVATSAAASAVA